jgi:hypothetical protein
MTVTELDEVVDLEMQLGLTPSCEDDHQWYDEDDELIVPVCAVEAVALLIQSCPPLPGERPRELICRPLAEWLEENGSCSLHQDENHLAIRWL